MKARPYSKWLSRAYIFLVGALTFTGFMQMPLANRYYLVDVPGMAWTGDFFFVHKFHYVLAAALLFVIGVACTNWLLQWRDRLVLPTIARVRIGIVAGIVISGLFRVYRNLPDVTLEPVLVVTIEWVHFGLVMVLGVAALAALVKKASAYARLKK